MDGLGPKAPQKDLACGAAVVPRLRLLQRCFVHLCVVMYVIVTVCRNPQYGFRVLCVVGGVCL